jgi:hypothetical protein
MDDVTLVLEIAGRYSSLVTKYNIIPLCSEEDLAVSLSGAHSVQPMSLDRLVNLCDLDLVLEVDDICLHYSADERRFKDNYRSKFAL